MVRLTTRLTLPAILLALATTVSAGPDREEVRDIDSLRLGRQVAGSRLTFEDLDGRVVLAYHWCVS
jgi:hypothetical protein